MPGTSSTPADISFLAFLSSFSTVGSSYRRGSDGPAGFLYSLMLATPPDQWSDLCAVLPIVSVWNPDIKATSSIDGKSLFLANCGFNIATDVILLVLPLIVIWSMKSTRLHKVGLSGIFRLGALTVSGIFANFGALNNTILVTR